MQSEIENLKKQFEHFRRLRQEKHLKRLQFVDSVEKNIHEENLSEKCATSQKSEESIVGISNSPSEKYSKFSESLKTNQKGLNFNNSIILILIFEIPHSIV
jgi:hypothetical protein